MSIETRAVGNGASLWTRLAVLALALYSVGNLLPPSLLGGFSALYLPLCISVMAITLLSVDRLLWRSGSALVLIAGVALTMIPGLLTARTEYSDSKSLGVALMFLAILSAMTLLDREANRRLFLGAIVGLSGVSTIAAVVFGVEVGTGRVSLLGQNPIAAARLAGVVFVSSCVVLLAMPTWRYLKSTCLVLAASVSLVAMVQSGSRGPLLSAGAAVVLIGVFGPRVQRHWTMLAAAAAALALLFVLTYIPEVFDQRAFSSDDSGRSDLSSAALALVREYPAGIGWGNFANYVSVSGTGEDRVLYSHNLFLEFALEGGLVALLGIVVIIGAAVKRIVRTRLQVRTTESVLAAIFIYALANAQFSSDLVGNRILWVSLGAALVIHFTAQLDPARVVGGPGRSPAPRKRRTRHGRLRRERARITRVQNSVRNMN